MQICEVRNDQQARDIHIRLQGAVSDLHAAEAQYHDDCRLKFMNPKAVTAAATVKMKSEEQADADVAFTAVINDMLENEAYIWSSVEIYSIYELTGGCILSRISLLQKLTEYFHPELLVLSSPGLSSILLFQKRASDLLRVVEEDDEYMVSVVAKKIAKESQTLPHNKNIYKTQIDASIALEDVSPTLLTLLSSISANLKSTLPAIVIGNVIMSVIWNKAAPLQIALGILAREKS